MGTTDKKSNKNVPPVIEAFKEIGETPLDVVSELKKELPEVADLPITYAGRLDPMAEGLLLLLIGEEAKQKEKYLALDKTYTFDVLFGFSTDTHDILGKVTNTDESLVDRASINTELKGFIGEYEEPYPPFSSKTVEGKPLFEWSRESRLHEITIPTHPVRVDSVDLLSLETISKEMLLSTIVERISLVEGDFRQKEILELWKAYIENSAQESFQVAHCTLSCGSGTYVRSLVHKLGKQLGTVATTLYICRTKIGTYSLEK